MSNRFRVAVLLALAAIVSTGVFADAEAANMVRLTLDTRIECTAPNQACGETFTSSEIVEIDPEHVGKTHIIVTRIWVCAGIRGLLDENVKQGPAQEGALLLGYATVSPILGDQFTATGAKGRVTGGIQNVFFMFASDPFCTSAFC
ncbi:MAG TPA: hypothetical protein VLU25_11580 [Acidobacteriota bacterium]|nr:hypothetical protein [Acidobacteriota bacterium]